MAGGGKNLLEYLAAFALGILISVLGAGRSLVMSCALNILEVMLVCGEHCKRKGVLCNALERFNTLANLPLLEGIVESFVCILFNGIHYLFGNESVNVFNLVAVVYLFGVDISAGGQVVSIGNIDFLHDLFKHSFKFGRIVRVKGNLGDLDAL